MFWNKYFALMCWQIDNYIFCYVCILLGFNYCEETKNKKQIRCYFLQRRVFNTKFGLKKYLGT